MRTSLLLSEFESALAWNCQIHRPQKFALSRLDDNPLVEFGSRAPRRLGFFEVFWIESGSGTVRNGACVHSLKSGALFFVSPGQHYFWEPDEFIRGEWAGFTEEFLAMGSTVGPEWLSGMPFFYDEENALLQLEPGENADFRSLFSTFRATAYNNESGLDDIVRAHLTLILCKAKQLFARNRAEAGNTQESSLLTRFRLILEEQFPRLCSVGEYAELLGVSRAHFCAEVRRRCGLSPGQVIQLRKVLEAKRRLLHTSCTVSEIAYGLEFEDPSYFVRYFKRRTGITPSQYRAAMRQDEAVG
jgi:AraC-like DNA-binding protein